MAKTTFVDGNIVTKLPGTRVLAAWLNKVFNHRHDGRDQDGSAPLDYATDTGSANNCIITLAPALDTNIEGLVIWFKVAADCTGAVTLKINDLAAAPIVRNVSDALGAGDIKAGQIIGVVWNGAGGAYQLTAYQNPPVTDADTLNSQTAAMLTPPGAIMAFATQTTPDGWEPCDGRELLREGKYATLFSKIGTAWGDGDTITTFNVPNLQGEFLRGWDNGRGVDPDRAFASFQGDEIKSHTHPLTKSSIISDTTSGGDSKPVGAYGDSGAFGGTETRPRNIAVKYCIKY